MELSQLNDDRFGNFLDAFYDAGCRNIFREISGRAFTEYGLKVKNINYDTTSKVMWGAYEYTNNSSDSNDDISYISIDFGHSKDKRDDKKQIKIGLGTTNGVVTDAKVLSGNMDDKTYNKENLEDVDELLTQMKVDRNEFYYIADSALFTTKNIEKANEHHIKFITRMPDNIKVAKKFLDTPLPNDAQSITIKNAHDEEIVYKLIDTQEEYMKGIPVNLLLSILPHWKRPSGRLALRKLKKRKSKFKRH
jgi:transposase